MHHYVFFPSRHLLFIYASPLPRPKAVRPWARKWKPVKTTTAAKQPRALPGKEQPIILLLPPKKHIQGTLAHIYLHFYKVFNKLSRILSKLCFMFNYLLIFACQPQRWIISKYVWDFRFWRQNYTIVNVLWLQQTKNTMNL